MTVVVGAMPEGRFRLDVVHGDRVVAVYVNTAAEARLFLAQARALARTKNYQLDVVGAELCR